MSHYKPFTITTADRELLAQPYRPTLWQIAQHNLRLMAAGFKPDFPVQVRILDEPKPEHNWVQYILEQCQCPTDLRGDGIYAVGVKRGPIRQRFPQWLYCGKD